MRPKKKGQKMYGEGWVEGSDIIKKCQEIHLPMNTLPQNDQ